MPHSAKTKPHHKEVNRKEKLSDEALLDLVQRQTFLFFWDGARAGERPRARSRRDGWRIPPTMTSPRAAPALA